MTICCKAIGNKPRNSRALALLASLILAGLCQLAAADTLLNGLASHTEFSKEQYIAALYLDTTSSVSDDITNAPGLKRMRMHISSKRIPSRSFRNNWLQRIAINNPDASLIKFAPSMAEFAKFIRQRYRQGDHLEFKLDQAGATVISLNEIELGKISKPGFFNLLLRTWIGPVPINTGFRENILAAGAIDAALLERFQTIAPTAQRISQLQDSLIKKALAAAPQAQVATQIEAPKLDKQDPAPKVAAATPEPKPEPKIPAKPEPIVVAAILDDDELEEEDISEADISAESILSRQLYQSKLVKWTYKHVAYPKRAIKRQQEGRVLLQITLNRDGLVEELNVIEASKYGALNRAAEKAIAKASPFPAMPDVITDAQFNFTLPVTFRLPK